MGWWSYENDKSVLLGDEVMDATYDYFERLRDLYAERVHRRPSIGELQAVLRLALRVNGEKYLDDVEDGKQIQSVRVKMAKRSKKQKFNVGDVFAIPIKRGQYMFGRIVNLEDGWELIEVFAHKSSSPEYTPDIVKAKRLLPPLWINPRELFAEGTWKIIHSDPSYDPSVLSSLKYVMGTPGNYRWVRVNGFQPQGKLTDEEAAALPAWALMPHDAVIEAIEEAARSQNLR
jgi:Immunity protein 26